METPELNCVQCGYHSNKLASPQEPGATATIDDLSMCLNCGQVYVLEARGWRALSDAEIAQLPDDLRSFYDVLARARQKVITEDLALKQKFHSS